jgi:hypothetical protein
MHAHLTSSEIQKLEKYFLLIFFVKTRIYIIVRDWSYSFILPESSSGSSDSSSKQKKYIDSHSDCFDAIIAKILVTINFFFG